MSDLVRPFVMTGGRTRASDTLRIETLVQTASADAGTAAFEAGQILQLCRTPHSIAEVAAKLGVPLGVVATKFDKLTRAERSRAQRDFERAFTTPVLPLSAATGEGLKELWTLIRRLLSSSRPPRPKSPRSSISQH